MSYRVEDNVTVIGSGAPFKSRNGVVKLIDDAWPTLVLFGVLLDGMITPCWFYADEISPHDVDAPTEQIPAVTG